MIVLNESVKGIQRENFNKVAAGYKKRLGSKANYYISNSISKILARLNAHFGENLVNKTGLDIGCGVGDIAAALAPHCEAIQGIDISEGMIEQARVTHSSLRNLSFNVCSADSLPFQSNSFDFIVSVHSFHHLIDETIIKNTLQEIFRVTKGDGLIIIADANPENPLIPLFQKIQQKWGVDAGNERLLSRSYLMGKLDASGIKAVDNSTYSFIPHFTPWLKFLEPKLEKSFLKSLGKDYLIVAKPLK